MLAGPLVESKGARLVAIAKERLGHEEFLADHWNNSGAMRDQWNLPAEPSVLLEDSDNNQAGNPHSNPELFYDKETKPPFPLFKHTNGKKMGIGPGIFSYLIGGAVAKNNKRVDQRGIKGDLKGEGTILGAVLVISKDGKILLHHQETSWGNHPEDSQLMAAISQL